MKKITIKTRGYKIDNSFALLPVILLDKDYKTRSLTLGWWRWAFEIGFEKG